VSDPATPAAAHELLARCLVEPGADASAALDEVRTLALPARDWLLLQLHQRTFGRDIVGDVQCPHCQSPSEIRIAARDLAGPPRPPEAPIAVTLPSGATAVVRALTAGDHEHFASLAGLDAAAQQHEVLTRLVVTGAAAAGAADPDRLDAGDRLALASALDAAAPDPIQFDLTCPECGAAFAAPFDAGRFVLSELAAHSRTLLDDVHALAMVYHWSEAAILRLPLTRRLAYLDRIDADRTRGLVREETFR
jgi:hypothetical protein